MNSYATAYILSNRLEKLIDNYKRVNHYSYLENNSNWINTIMDYEVSTRNIWLDLQFIRKVNFKVEEVSDAEYKYLITMELFNNYDELEDVVYFWLLTENIWGVINSKTYRISSLIFYIISAITQSKLAKVEYNGETVINKLNDLSKKTEYEPRILRITDNILLIFELVVAFFVGMVVMAIYYQF